MNLPDSAILNNLHVLGHSQMADPFEKRYIRARAREQRICNDDEVYRLPEVARNHAHYGEWQMRKESCSKLINYLTRKNRALRILEIGCGNGWLSFQLAGIPQSYTIGQDINFTELQQAARVFKAHNRLRFVYGDLFSGILDDKKFDIIVMAASIQYFPSVNRILALALDLLSDGGEIHILDTRFYKADELPAARQRSLDHYRSMGCAEMAQHYFHHARNSLDIFRHHLLFNPWSWKQKLQRSANPFPWIRIKKN